MNWKYKGKEVSNVKQLPENAIGFIYRLKFSDGRDYIGRKGLYSTRKKPLGKRALSQVTDKRKKKYEVIVKESDWAKYTSSNLTIKERLKDGSITLESKEILRICFTEKQMTYYETQMLFCFGVLENGGEYYNDNILGKFFRRDLSRIPEDDEIKDA